MRTFTAGGDPKAAVTVDGAPALQSGGANESAASDPSLW
jgi:hypothetical protein